MTEKERVRESNTETIEPEAILEKKRRRKRVDVVKPGTNGFNGCRCWPPGFKKRRIALPGRISSQTDCSFGTAQDRHASRERRKGKRRKEKKRGRESK